MKIRIQIIDEEDWVRDGITVKIPVFNKFNVAVALVNALHLLIRRNTPRGIPQYVLEQLNRLSIE